MAWGFRRSIKLAGPLRLNLSKSGLGLSLGVPGFHIGTGPRGRYVRAGLPGTGIYYRKSLNKKATERPAPVHVTPPSYAQQQTGWMYAVKALLAGDAARCLQFLDHGVLGNGPAVHLAVEKDVVVTLLPDACGIAVIRAEALERLGRHAEALAAVDTAAQRGCRVAQIVASELRG